MPYINPDRRVELKQPFLEIYSALFDIPKSERAGCLNYIITRLIRELYHTPNYRDCNEVMGVLECAKQEYYRMVVAPYEEVKKEQNGDV